MPRRHPFLRSMRLRTGAEFSRVYREGSRAKGDAATIAVAPNGLDVTRLGLSIGKRVWKHAVRRNRLRRVWREAFRLEYAHLPRGVDLVVIGSVPRAEVGLSQAREELVRLAQKAARRGEERARGRREEGVEEHV
jgi:ribonuclease P protein component